ncbi:hypothetical protein BJ165DRAFT_1357712, partial [Panaeolus papilionaceus]
RFACIPTFSNGTIRKFAANCSEMKKMAARDFEDLLQCSIPAFGGLLEEPHNQRLMELLYRMAEWHALAKLRMQTEKTLHLLEEVTTELGKALREFRDTTCAHFTTLELPKEAAARVRREIAASVGAPGQEVITNSETLASPESRNRNSRRAKTLNLQTIKMHFLGDYAEHVRLFGTSDSYSTQLVRYFILFKHSQTLVTRNCVGRESASRGQGTLLYNQQKGRNGPSWKEARPTGCISCR